MDRSEGCQSLRGVEWDYETPDPTYKTSWRTQVGKWKTYEIPKDHQTRQYIYGLKPGCGLPRNMDKTNAEWAQKGAKLQAARRDRGIHEVLTDDKHYFKVIAERMLD